MRDLSDDPPYDPSQPLTLEEQVECYQVALFSIEVLLKQGRIDAARMIVAAALGHPDPSDEVENLQRAYLGPLPHREGT